MHEEASKIIISNGFLSVTSSPPTPHTPTAINNNINNISNIVATTASSSSSSSSGINVITTNFELNNDLSSLPVDIQSVPVTTTSHTVIINNGERCGGSECINLAPDQSLTNNVEIEIQDIPYEGRIFIKFFLFFQLIIVVVVGLVCC